MPGLTKRSHTPQRTTHDTMQAYVYRRYGPPEVIEKVNLPCPQPNDTEVLVRVYATTVSSADWRLRSLTMPKGLGWIGRPAIGLFGPRKPILGTEFSGVIAATGKNVGQFRVGDPVIGFPGEALGAHAEYVVMPADGKILHKPESLSFAQAAALPFGAATAYDYLVNKGRVKAGEQVLVNGSTGAVGLACVQIAVHFGASVTAVCSDKHRAFLHQLGVQETIDYAQTDFASGPETYDVIVDTVGTAPWARSRRALRSGGRMLLIAGKASDMILGPLRARLSGESLIAGVARESPAILEAVVTLAARGDLVPVIDREYPFDQMIAAHRYVDTGRKRGAVVVHVTDASADDGQHPSPEL